MRERPTFRDKARRAYERGRLRASLRVVMAVVPLVALCIWETRAYSRSFVVGLALLLLAVGLRWRQRRGFWVVSTGLKTGVLPLLAALALCRFAPSCPPHVALTLCGSAGLVSGGLIGRSMLRTPALWHQWSGAASVAALTAALGCLALGVGSAVGAAAAVATGVAAAAAVPRALSPSS